MTTYFTAPDGHDEPTLWAQYSRYPAPIVRRCDLGPMAHHWDELVARVIAGNPDRVRLSEGEHWAPGIPDHIAREMNK